jgi:hypothetical protein
MNNHWKIARKTKNQAENDFSKKVGLHAQIGGVSQPDNREITQLVGLHIRYGACMKQSCKIENG